MECQSSHPGHWEGRPHRTTDASGQGSMGCTAEGERPVVSQTDSHTGTGRCSQKGSVLQQRDPAHSIKDQVKASLEGRRCSLCPKSLMCFEGVQGAPSYCGKELPTLPSNHSAWAFLYWTRLHSTPLRAWLLSQWFQSSFPLLKYQKLQFNSTDPTPHTSWP